MTADLPPLSWIFKRAVLPWRVRLACCRACWHTLVIVRAPLQHVTRTLDQHPSKWTAQVNTGVPAPKRYVLHQKCFRECLSSSTALQVLHAATWCAFTLSRSVLNPPTPHGVACVRGTYVCWYACRPGAMCKSVQEMELSCRGWIPLDYTL